MSREERIYERQVLERAAFAFHAGAFVLIALIIGVYAPVSKPNDHTWLFWLAGWGIVVAVHGILSRRIRDAPEDIFV